jgi:hypothetical protein
MENAAVLFCITLLEDDKMHLNMGSTDRWARAVVGIVLLGLAYATLAGIWQWGFGIIGAILVITAVVGLCPLYSVFGWSTKSGHQN